MGIKLQDKKLFSSSGKKPYFIRNMLQGVWFLFWVLYC